MQPHDCYLLPLQTLILLFVLRNWTVQSVARSGESTSSLHKPPKGLSRVGPIATTPAKRVSLGAKNVKMEKDAKSVTGNSNYYLFR